MNTSTAVIFENDNDDNGSIPLLNRRRANIGRPVSREASPTHRTRRSVPIRNSYSERLRETDAPNNSPPLAGPEVDDLDTENENSDPEGTTGNGAPYPGVDDGFFSTEQPRTDGDGLPGTENNPDNIPVDFPGGESDNTPRKPEQPIHPPRHPENPPYPETPLFPGINPPTYPRGNTPTYPRGGDGGGYYPYAPGFVPGSPGYDNPGNPGFNVPADPGIPVRPGEKIPDVNVYQHKKTVAQGMMDLALFSANANQLRYVLETKGGHAYYYTSIVLISLSLILQLAIGVGLIWNSRYNVKRQKEICIADKINNFTVIGIFIVTTINVFISAFGAPGPIISTENNV